MKKTKAELIRDVIAGEIKSGKLKSGQKMYGMRELASRFNVSFAVINSAYNQLAGENLIIRKNRSGTYVNPSPAVRPAKAVALITTYQSKTIENYFEPLLMLAGENKIIPMISPPVDIREFASVINDIMSRRPDGVLIDVAIRDNELEMIIDYVKDVPHCFVNRWEWDVRVPANSVLIDYSAGYAAAIKHFLACGHTAIGVIGHASIPKNLFRRQLEAAFAANQLEFDESYYLGMTNPHITADKIQDFFRKKAPTAVLAMSDYLIEVLNMNLKDAYPEWRMVDKVGLYNLHYSRVRGREFSTIEPGFDRMWKLAFERLNKPVKNISYIKPEMIFR